MDKWERIILLHRLLGRNKYSTPLETILNELECHPATFYRIRDYMINALGAPIINDHKYHGYRYDAIDGRQFELPGFWLTKDEIEALLCLDHAVETIHEDFFHGLLEPVRKRFEPMLKAQKTSLKTVRERIKILSMASRECNKEIFRKIASAVVAERRLSIKHRNLDKDAARERVISPQALIRYRDNWYVDAFCHLRNDLREFALDRIETAEFERGEFQKVPKDRLDAFFGESYGIFTGPADKRAVIDFTGIAARAVSREKWHPKQGGEWRDESIYRLVIPYGHSRELIMDVLRWGDEAEVIEPKELREAVVTMVEKMKKNYEK
jgi:predicted DNA-binding transcriptional regulator YafY